MELKDYVRILRRSWVLVLVCSFIGLLSAAAITLTVPPTYTAKTQLFVAIQNSGSVSELQQGNNFSQARVKSYVEIAKTPAVLQPAIDELALEMDPTELLTKVRASADLNTVLITIAIDDESPVQAAAIAQAMGSSLVSVVESLEKSGDAGVSPVKLSVVTPAVAPSSPSAPATELNLAIGLLVGLATGVALATLRATMDTKVRSEEDATRISSSPVLGAIPFDSDVAKNPLVTQTAPQSVRAESFRQIRTNLKFANVNSTSNALLITSSMPGEGKSTTATNLAIAMAQSGQRVVLVDGDLRRPSVAKYLGLEGSAGLTTALIGNATVEELLQPWGEDQLYVLASGHVPPNPSELLGSEAMAQLIRGLEDAFDVVIIDAPPLGPVTDGTVLAQQVGGVVLVVGSGKIKTQHLEKSLASLAMVDANMLGIVVNLLPAKGPDAYAYSYYTSEASDSDYRRHMASTSRVHKGGQIGTSAALSQIATVEREPTRRERR